MLDMTSPDGARMTPATNPPPPSEPVAAAPRPSTPEEVLAALVPREPAERKRAFAALLRAVVDERPVQGASQ